MRFLIAYNRAIRGDKTAANCNLKSQKQSSGPVAFSSSQFYLNFSKPSILVM